MAGGHLWLLLFEVFAGLADGLRFSEQPSISGKAAPLRAAREAGICGKKSVPLDLARHEGVQADCDELIPRYDMAQWMKTHGRVVPDHPAVFVNTGTHEAEVFPSMETFLELHGEEVVVALPEYAESGGHLKDPNARGKVTASFRDLAKSWNETLVYLSDFKCLDGSLCQRSSIQFGAPALFATTTFDSKNFLVGGPDTGLPFHKHGMTWQGLTMGRKAWYVIPPGSMSEELHDMTGPYIFPVRAYHGAMLSRPVGQRPLYCVQHPGEIFYVPYAWWHATMNLDRFQVAYGEKPGNKIQQSPMSSVLSRIMQTLPQQSWDTAGFTPALAGGANLDRAMPYSLQARSETLKKTCGQGIDNATFGLEEPLRRIREISSTTQAMACGLAETAAFAHCEMARLSERLMGPNCKRNPGREKDLKQRAAHWLEEAHKLSPALVQRENRICRSIKMI